MKPIDFWAKFNVNFGPLPDDATLCLANNHTGHTRKALAEGKADLDVTQVNVKIK